MNTIWSNQPAGLPRDGGVDTDGFSYVITIHVALDWIVI